MGIDAPKEESFAMKAGHYLEDAVSRFFQDETGATVIKASAGDWIACDATRDYVRVSPDRTYWREGDKHNEANKGICEIKTTQMPIDADYVPQHWFCQLQYQLGVMGYDHGALAWLTSGREFGYKYFTFDKEFYGAMLDVVDRFWLDNILGKREPEPTTVEDILLLNPRHSEGKKVVATDELLETCSRLKAMKEELSSAEAEKKRLEDEIKMFMEDAEMLVSSQAVQLASWKAAKDSVKFDEKTFKEDNPELWEKYTKTVTGSRRFLLK